MSAQHSVRPIEVARIGGVEVLDEMVLDHTLLPTHEFAQLRGGWTSLGPHQARGAGQMLSVFVRGRCHFPAVLAALPKEFAVRLVAAMRGTSETKLFLFLLRRHGALEGATVLYAHRHGAGERVLELARAWVDEEVQ